MDLLNRRQFISKTGLTFGGLLAGPLIGSRAWGSLVGDGLPDDGHFFLMINTSGGMDVTLGLDPWVLPAGAAVTDMFIEYKPDEILQAASLKFAPAAEPLKQFADKCAIINGVMMSDIDN